MHLDYRPAVLIGLANDGWFVPRFILIIVEPRVSVGLVLQMVPGLCGFQEEDASKLVRSWVEDHATPVLRDGQTVSEVPRGQVPQNHNEKLGLRYISDGTNAHFGQKLTMLKTVCTETPEPRIASWS